MVPLHREIQIPNDKIHKLEWTNECLSWLCTHTKWKMRSSYVIGEWQPMQCAIEWAKTSLFLWPPETRMPVHQLTKNSFLSILLLYKINDAREHSAVKINKQRKKRRLFSNRLGVCAQMTEQSICQCFRFNFPPFFFWGFGECVWVWGSEWSGRQSIHVTCDAHRIIWIKIDK